MRIVQSVAHGSNMKNDAEMNDPSETSPLTPEEERWVDFIERLPQESDAKLSSFAEKLLTLSAGIAAAYVAALKVIDATLVWWHIIPIVMFAVTLLSSLLSIYPIRVTMRLENLDLVQRDFSRRLDSRWKLMTVGVIAFIIGLVSAIVIVMIL
jgi:hypothetical protein